MKTNITDKVQNESPQKSWWNNPLVGDKSLIAMIKNFWRSKFLQMNVPETSVKLYQDSLRQLRNIAAIAKTIDNAKFTSKEFMNFVVINAAIKNDQDEYKGLRSSIELLRVALETKDCFLKIEATESRYHSYSQQEFYDYILELLQQNIETEEFKKLVQKQLAEVITKVKTEEGKAALQAYVNQLDILSADVLGLKLLYLFKQYDLSNFALLRTVAEIADSFYDKNLDTLKEFSLVVQVNAQMFLKLGQVIQVPTAKNVPNTYALMLRYIALRNRHQKSFGQFQQLISILKDWLRFYEPILAISQAYPPGEYKQPTVFQEEIPGLNLYNKYQKYIDAI